MTHEDVEKIIFNQDYSNNQSSTYQQDKFYEKLDVLKEKDNVNHPDHYQSKSSVQIECIDAMRAAFGDNETAIFCKLNAMKYIWRSDSKNGIEDIDKALWYLEKYRKLGGEEQ